MTQYIDKDALVAEINNRIKGLKDCHADTVAGYAGEIAGLKRLLSVLDTLEVNEMDLGKVIDGLTAGWIEGEEYGELQNINTCRCVTLGEVKEAMRCMFELGLNEVIVRVTSEDGEHVTDYIFNVTREVRDDKSSSQ